MHKDLGLFPLNDCVLVELQQSFKNLSIKEGKYDTRTEGVVIAVPQKISQKILEIGLDGGDIKDLAGKRVHFEQFNEGARIKRNSKIYAFIKIEDIRGYENVETD